MCINLDVGGDEVSEGNCPRRKEQNLYHVCLFVLHVLRDSGIVEIDFRY